MLFVKYGVNFAFLNVFPWLRAWFHMVAILISIMPAQKLPGSWLSCDNTSIL